MTSRKASTNNSVFARLLRVALSGRGRFVTFGLVVVAMAAAAVVHYWPDLRAGILRNPDLWLAEDAVRITPLPPWIRTDVRGEVLRDGSLDGRVSILDPDLARRLSEAFALHPWVARVTRVTKRHPAGVTVDLEYRRPVCMVKVAGRLFPPNAEGARVPDGYYPIDVEGILLPTADFSPVETARYPRLVNVDSLPVGLPGTRWGDMRIQGAAAIAALLVDVWADWDLDRMELVKGAQPTSRDNAHEYRLLAASGAPIRWGHPPGQETAGEVTAAEKLARLEATQAEGLLDTADGRAPIDLRYPDPSAARGETADRRNSRDE